MQCPDCGAYYAEEDEFCGECGRKLPGEVGDDPQEAETWTAEPDSLEDPAGDLFEPPPPEPARIEIPPKQSNLRTIAIVIGLALLVLCLCVVGAVIWLVVGDDSAVEPTSVLPEPGPLLYEEDFDFVGDGWSTFDGDRTAVHYEDGGYQLTINRIERVVWGNPEPPLELTDLVIEVDVRQVEGPLDNHFGVLVRVVEDDETDAYYFQISGDGYYSVDLRWEGEWLPLVSWEESTAIYTGLGVTNRIRVVCFGDQFRFYVNNRHLVDLTDDTISRGSIGLAAGTIEEPGVIVQFDNLRVYELGE